MATYLVEYTQGRGTKSRFEKVEAESPAHAADEFIDATSGTYMRNVWVVAEEWVKGSDLPEVSR